MIQRNSALSQPTSPSKSATPATHSTDSPRPEFTARFIDSVDELESLRESWERLMNTAIHRNLMFDPDFLIPAFKHLSDDSVRILVVDAPQKSNPDGPTVLCGLLPLETSKIYGIPIATLQVWLHEQCVDGTPLLRSDCATDVLNVMLDFLAESEHTKLLSLNSVSNEAKFAEVLTDVMSVRNVKPFHRASYTRACFRPEQDVETYFERHVSGGVKRTQRRLARRLAESGDVTVTVCRDTESSESMIEHFLRLEMSGWKAEAETAIKSDESSQNFFREMVNRAMQRNKLSFLTINFNGQPISMLCDLYSGDLGYAYKTAFDNDMKQFSPGMMAEMRNLEYMHDAGVKLVDSCTSPDNETINRIWGGRLRFQDLVIPLSGRIARWATAAMPMIQQLKGLKA